MTEKRKIIEIEVGKQYLDPSKYSVPQVLKTWDEDNKPSEEYKEMIVELLSIGQYIASQLNDGPETKDSIVKRTIALKIILSELLWGTFLNGYQRYGLLNEIMMDMYMDISGLMKVANMLQIAKARLTKKMQEELGKKTESYTA